MKGAIKLVDGEQGGKRRRGRHIASNRLDKKAPLSKAKNLPENLITLQGI